jgi:hypothetical protein
VRPQDSAGIEGHIDCGLGRSWHHALPDSPRGGPVVLALKSAEPAHNGFRARESRPIQAAGDEAPAGDQGTGQL